MGLSSQRLKIPGSTDEMGRLRSLAKSEWLDKLNFRRFMQRTETQKSENLCLYINLLRFDFLIIFSEPVFDEPCFDLCTTTTYPIFRQFDNTHSWSIIDPEVTRENPVRQLMRADEEELLLYLLQLVPALKFERAATDHRSSRSATNAISCDDSGLTNFFISRKEGSAKFDTRQGQLVETLAKRAREFRTFEDPSIKKKERLQTLLADSKNNLSSTPPLPLPLNTQIEIIDIIPEKLSVFKSAIVTSNIQGWGMRQDQLVLQMFTLMDRLLRQENLDSKLTPYAVLATGPMQGMAQFVPSKTIAAIVQNQRPISMTFPSCMYSCKWGQSRSMWLSLQRKQRISIGRGAGCGGYGNIGIAGVAAATETEVVEGADWENGDGTTLAMLGASWMSRAYVPI
ncbi:kinase-like protein [Gymnopus androsaceus JB14]|uniref:Kinase-like protein n=1 Tax=Gymnopus androsaceus JB14 TaxID=1447944 RepID=A0A6A4GDC3_9AGAR|nr:kinase-like protein [Gymnopus androsaceus JB14]